MISFFKIKSAFKHILIDIARCPFRDDHTPSIKLNEDYFYCFGSGVSGDVITFTARLFNLRPYEAARKLASDFNIPVDIPLPESNTLRTFRMDQYRCQRALDSYDVYEDFLRRGSADLPKKYTSVMQKAAKEYSATILAKLREYAYNPGIMRLTVMGGGACILKHFWDGINGYSTLTTSAPQRRAMSCWR